MRVGVLLAVTDIMTTPAKRNGMIENWRWGLACWSVGNTVLYDGGPSSFAECGFVGASSP